MAAGLRGAVWALALGYPVALYWALTRYGVASAAVVGLAGALLWAIRVAFEREGSRALWALPLAVLGLSALSLLTTDPRLLLSLPVAINGVLLVTFGGSLRGGPTYVERIARLREPMLTPAQVRHCRQFTWAWVVFFVVNGSITAGLALAGAVEAWTLYTAGMSYVLIGLLFLAEWCVRRLRFGGKGAAAQPQELRR